MNIDVFSKSQLNHEIQEQSVLLFQQLNSEIHQRPLNEVLDQDENIIFVACLIEGKLVGMATMALYKVISGYKGMIEDVVVDRDQRGSGIGRKLMERLLKEGKNRNLNEILLFSGHHRKAAISLYKSLGFQLKSSGLYALKP